MRRLWCQRWCQLGPLVALVVSCSTLQAPRPEALAPTHLGWNLPASTLVVPLRVPQTQIVTWGEQTVPPHLEGRGEGQRTLSAWFLKHDWHYWWSYKLVRTPLKVSFAGRTIRVSAGLSGELTAGWDTLPGEISTQVEADAGVETTLDVTPRWSLESQPRVFLEVHRAEVPIGISWNGNFFGETISVADSVKEALDPSLGDLEAQLKRWLDVDIRSGVEDAWKGLQEPQTLGPGLWFTLTPEAVALGPIQATRDSLGLDLVLKARPTLTLGSRPPVAFRPLPPAETAGAIDPVMVIHLPVTLGWAEASRIVQNRPLVLGTGVRVVVRALSASAQGDRVLVRLDAQVSPSWPGVPVDAVLWLSGRPVWNPGTQCLGVVDLELDVRTKDFLTQAAAWLLTPGWVADLEKALVWNLGPRLADLEAQANDALSSVKLKPNFLLKAQVTGLEVVDVAVSAQGAEVLTRLQASASVDWIP